MRGCCAARWPKERRPYDSWSVAHDGAQWCSRDIVSVTHLQCERCVTMLTLVPTTMTNTISGASGTSSTRGMPISVSNQRTSSTPAGLVECHRPERREHKDQ